MADGCSLYFTEKDLNQVEKSLTVGNQIDETKTARSILNGRVINSAEDFRAILADPDDPRHAIVQQLLEKALSNGKLNSADEAKLMSALLKVLNLQDNPQGLFQNPPKHQGPGADSMKHGGELLTTAAIIQSKFWGGIQTSLGNRLYIDKVTDIIGFGQKLPAQFALPTKKKGTIEADTLISRITRYDPIFKMHEFDRIAIDTKYIKHPKLHTTYGVMPGFDRQLNGIRNAFRDGSIQEFYFVSNVDFSEGFKNTVRDYNISIFKDRIESDKILLSDVEKYLTPRERETYISKDLENFDFHKHPEVLEKAAKDYGVPQIGYCQNVNYTPL